MRLVVRHPTVSVGVIPVDDAGRIVLMRRADSDLFGIPGGIMDWGETVEDTARRELREEIGAEITRLVRMVGVYSSPRRDPRTHAVCITVVAEIEGELEISDPLEVSEIHRFAPDELPLEHLAFDGGQQLRDFLDERTAIR
jgi:ADP-ribose pyrophosphatase/8-oxo-dGTP diphosphatase